MLCSYEAGLSLRAEIVTIAPGTQQFLSGGMHATARERYVCSSMYAAYTSLYSLTPVAYVLSAPGVPCEVVFGIPKSDKGLSYAGHEPVFYRLFEALYARRISSWPRTRGQAQITRAACLVGCQIHARPDGDASGDVFPGDLVGMLVVAFCGCAALTDNNVEVERFVTDRRHALGQWPRMGFFHDRLIVHCIAQISV